MSSKRVDLSRPHFPFARDEVYYQPPPELLPATSWRPPRLEDMPPSLNDAKVICLDLECRDPTLKQLGPGCRRDPKENYVVGYGLAIEDGPEFYLPTKHLGGDNCDWNVRDWIRDQIRNFKGTIVLNGGGYDLDWFATDTGDEAILDKQIDDVQIRDPLIYELHDRYNLDELCLRYGLPGKDETILREAAQAFRIDPKKDLWKLPARYVAQYGMMDVRRPLQVRRRQIPKMHEEGVVDIWNMEKRLTPILIKMRRMGVRVDTNHIAALVHMAIMKEEEHLNEVHSLTGIRVSRDDVWKAGVLAKPLEKSGYSIPKTELKENPKTGKMTGGKDSIDADFLSKCGKVGKNILRARKWNKLRDFCRQVSEQVIGDHVHCTFNQLKTNDDFGGDGKGVRYGRLSATDFNITQMPTRDPEFGLIFRKIFIAEHGAQFASSDWRQQEPRIGVHYAEILKLPGAKEFADEYRRNPKLDIHQKLTDLADDPVNYPRGIVKNFVNGRLYGMGDLLLCRHLHWPTETVFDPKWNGGKGGYRDIPTPESQEKIDKFLSFAAWIPGLTREAAAAATKNGCVWTILRRKCHFERGPDGKIWKAHKAFNRVGQGSAADQMKATLIAAWDEGIKIPLAVHDEFDFSFWDIKTALRVKELQQTVVKFNVPMDVDLEIGPSWGDLEKYE